MRRPAKETVVVEWCRCRRAPALGALVWMLYGTWSLSRAPEGWWRWRDDAVITLAHARGLADFGHPAVSAAAERVEGTSAPLQMIIGAIYYRLGGSGWSHFLDAQVVIGLAVSGWFAARLLAHAFPAARTTAIVVCTGIAAVTGFSTWAALGWFGSGMENSLTVPLLLAVAATATGVLTRADHRGWACGAALGLAGVVRVDFAVLLTPALAAVVAMLWTHRRDAAVRVLGVALSSWLALHAWRWLTFHSLEPNTAVVQQKHTVDLGHLRWLVATAAVVGAAMWAWHRPRLRMAAAASLAFGGVYVAIGALWTDSTRATGHIATPVVLALAGLSVVTAVAWVAGIGDAATWAPLVAVAAAPIGQELLLGPARLDGPRIGAQTLPVLAVGLGVALLGVATNLCRLVPQPTRADRKGLLRIGSGTMAVVTVVGVGLTAVSAAASTGKPYNLCCDIAGYSDVLARAEEHRVQVGLPRSITAAPDLGKFSFPRTNVVVDLGRLGDALLAEIDRERPDLVADYLTDVQPPDAVEIHGMWACNTYRGWIESASFMARYRAEQATPAATGDTCPYGSSALYYVRSTHLDASYAPEIRLAAALAHRPGDAVTLATDALARCGRDGDALSCGSVRRAVLRATPELRAAGSFEGVVEALALRSPTGRLDRLLLATPPGWAEAAAPMAISLLTTWQPCHTPLAHYEHEFDPRAEPRDPEPPDSGHRGLGRAGHRVDVAC